MTKYGNRALEKLVDIHYQEKIQGQEVGWFKEKIIKWRIKRLVKQKIKKITKQLMQLIKDNEN